MYNTITTVSVRRCCIMVPLQYWAFVGRSQQESPA